MARQGFTKAQRNKMFLSQPTYEGLKVTGKYKSGRNLNCRSFKPDNIVANLIFVFYPTVHSFIEATRFLLNSGVSMVLSNKFCQDPLEQHFGRHRCLGVRAENPTLWTYGYVFWSTSFEMLQSNVKIPVAYLAWGGGIGPCPERRKCILLTR